jgi:hypothetical protein
MALFACQCALPPGGVKIPVACLFLLAFLYPKSAGAQSCRGNPTEGCTNPGALCTTLGVAHGTCANVPGLPSGERECACVAPPGDACRAVCPVNLALANRLFFIRDLGDRCFDVGPPGSWAQGTPVLINACNGTATQQIRVKEIDGSHDVGLSVERPIPIAAESAPLTGTVTPPVAVGFCLGVHGGSVTPGAAIELQACNAQSPSQRFAVDGDAILMGSQTAAKVARDFVVERQNASTVPQTPLVVAKRDMWEVEPLRIDARYFRFNAVDGSGSAPTSAFLTVADEAHLICAAQCGWGTVVQIDDHDPLELTSLAFPGIGIADGTTIRGYRNSTYEGPEIRTCVLAPDQGEWAAFAITGRAIRVTGLRLHGPNADSRCGKDVENHSSDENGISVAPGTNPAAPSAWLDRLEVSNWPGSGIRIDGGDPTSTPGTIYPYQPFATVVANLIHDNTYGSNTQNSAFTQNRANIFYSQENQPVVSRIMGCGGGYAAMDNLFLSESSHISSDDVDMHGSLNPKHWDGGKAGDYFDVGSNTFLLKDKDNFVANVNLRGAPCRFTNVHDNVFVRSAGGAIHDPYIPPAPAEYANSFNAQDPTQGMLLPVGDFDGDRIDDVFLATGAAWYYSSAGQAEWRYLNRMPERASALLLGDFDGDGRTDVVTLHGSNIDVAWAGVSTWQTINVTAWPISDLAVGDFDGDGRSDLFLATGTQWFLASGGRNWVPFPAFTDAVSNLRFGHFTDKSKMQILRLRNHRWEVTEWGMTSWTDIGEAPTDSVAGLVVGDFNGDGFTDLARSVPLPPFPLPPAGSLIQYEWQYTSPGRASSWSGFGTYSDGMAAIGRFDGGAVTGLALWMNNKFFYTRGGTLQPLSRQPMR